MSKAATAKAQAKLAEILEVGSGSKLKEIMLKIKEKPGCLTVAEMRTHFEAAVNSTPAFKSNTPLDIVCINGEFSHYADPDADTMWLGFALGMRASERIAGLRRAGFFDRYPHKD